MINCIRARAAHQDEESAAWFTGITLSRERIRGRICGSEITATYVITIGRNFSGHRQCNPRFAAVILIAKYERNISAFGVDLNESVAIVAFNRNSPNLRLSFVKGSSGMGYQRSPRYVNRVAA